MTSVTEMRHRRDNLPTLLPGGRPVPAHRPTADAGNRLRMQDA